MTWIRRKKVAGHVYLYTVKSVRSGSKVRQIIVRYLGPARPIYSTGARPGPWHRPPPRPPSPDLSEQRPPKFDEREIAGPERFGKAFRRFDRGEEIIIQKPTHGLPKRSRGPRGRPKEGPSLAEQKVLAAACKKQETSRQKRRARNRRYYLARKAREARE